MRHVLLLVLTVAALPVPGWAQVLPPGAGAGFGNIYNGTPTRDFPAVVEVVIGNRDGTIGLCSGTLIAPRAVLTAAHCFAFGPETAIAAVFADGAARKDYDAVAFISHPKFSFSRSSVADVAIVVLATAVLDVVPLPLAQRAPRPGTTATIVGYGQEDNGGEAGRKEVGTVRLRRCPRVVRVSNGKVRLAKSLCWRPGIQGSDTCSGDSGGPLLVDGTVAGVTSGGIGMVPCPSSLSYDTNVARYRTWIETELRQHGG